MMTLLFMLLPLLGCYEPSIHVQDLQYFREAQQQSNATKSADQCQSIQNESMRGECIWYAAQKAITQGVDPFPICEKSPTLPWKHACVFEVADRNSVIGEKALIWCKQAGDFYRRCMYHAIQREETQLMKQYPFGKERELISEIQRRLSDVGEIKEDPLSQTLTARILAKRFVSKWKKNNELLFSEEHCGTAGMSICSDAYRFSLKLTRRRPQVCVVPMDVLLVKKARMPRWSEDFELQAMDAWEDFCRN
jgi:hypothetical protein